MPIFVLLNIQIHPVQKVIFRDIGLKDYSETWTYQGTLQKELIDKKLALRDLYKEDYVQQLKDTQRHYLLFCEHPHVYTLGRSGSEKNLLLSEETLLSKGATFFKINRGGDITYHGPGQIVGYPIFDMECFFSDVHQFVRYLEEIVIRTLAEYGLQGVRIKDYTGVWIEGTVKRKICAIGVHFSRWVTMHGFAFNINPQLEYFDYIIPCGIQEADKGVTSLSKELKREVPIAEVKEILKYQCATLFKFEYL